MESRGIPTDKEATLNRAYLLLGSNIDPEMHLPAAVRALSEFGRIAAVSSVWESAAVGDPAQPSFLNAAVLLETPLSAAALRTGPIAEIERRRHRVRDPQNVNAARTLDIDIVLFNQDVGEFGPVRVPDPDILRRPFLGMPLAEIAPEYVHPEDGRTLAEIAATFHDLSEALTLRSDVSLPFP